MGAPVPGGGSILEGSWSYTKSRIRFDPFREFTKLIGRHPKVLYSDLASEITSSSFERYLLVKGVNHVNVPRGEHHSIGVAEKAIQDLSNMMRCMLADSNVPNIYWDFVVEHTALVKSAIYLR